jgi:CIC family chloride channel protein
MRTCDDARAADEGRCWEMVGEGMYVDAAATLETAIPIFEKTGMEFLPVVTLSADAAPPELLGALFHVDALRAYNRALAATAAEEHS